MRWLLWSSGSQEEPDNNSSDDVKNISPSSPPCINCSTTNSSSSPAASPASLDTPPAPDTRGANSKKEGNWGSILKPAEWTDFTDLRIVIPTILLTSGILFSLQVYRRYLRRIPIATDISPSYFRRRSLLGKVTSVGDGDNFRMYHTPGGRLAGWGWLPFRKVPTSKKELKDRTIHIRLAGIDAPELAHFGRPAQPYAEDAHKWLTDYLLHRRIRAYIYRGDQYGRVVGTVYVRRFLLRRDVGLQMLREGFATVYEAKTGVEFGGKEMEEKYRQAEQWAKSKKKGLWKDHKKQSKGGWESPREYKTRMTQLEEQTKANNSQSRESSGKRSP
ncbi:hypothetical protein AJ80_02652 [Polytolypa hystricis UAMH7299]|uniref:Probable endonuclease LCL3 n=1 Tax=Polytolypa hystricis (strain UAMH7299) TaxID=1447883 RepID=A0A2B7YNL0_POLH7|nr:hypothetical protein AJ80_02652 [Polytolypa hystricis UAMH7299]